MTEPQTPAGASSLEGYFRENRDTVTEDALTAEAKAAGHSDQAIAEAWAAVKGELPPSQGGRATRKCSSPTR